MFKWLIGLFVFLVAHSGNKAIAIWIGRQGTSIGSSRCRTLGFQSHSTHVSALRGAANDGPFFDVRADSTAIARLGASAEKPGLEKFGLPHCSLGLILANGDAQQRNWRIVFTLCGGL